MNKTIAVLASLAVMGSAAECMAAAVVNINNYDVNLPLMYQPTSAAPVTAPDTGIFIQVLGGPVGGTLAPVTVGADSTFTGFDGGGFFDKGVGVVPGVADKAQADFSFHAWAGAAGSTWDAATVKNQPNQWTQVTGGWNNTSSPPGTPDNVPLQIPASALLVGASIPEPSTIALGILGAAALLIRRRK